ncbi:MAG: flippase [Nanoarchaeota archaeon]
MSKKEFNNILENLFETSIFIFVAIMISKIFSYIYKIIIARYLGADIYGIYSLSLIIVLLVASIFGFGISEGILRYISLYRGKNEQEKIKYLFKFSSKLLLILTIIASFILFFLSEFIAIKIFNNTSLAFFLKIFSFIIPIWIFSGYFMSIMIAFEKVKQQTFIEKIIQSSAKLSLLLLFLFLGLRTNAVILSFFIGVFIFFISTFLYCKYKLPFLFSEYNINNKEKKKIRMGLIYYSAPIMFFGLVFYIFYWTDSLILGFFKTTTEVGIYNAAVPLALLLSFAPELFITLLFPIIIKEYAKRKLNIINNLSKQIAKWIFIINLPLFILMVLFPEFIINIFFGSEYSSAVNTLRFLLIGNFFASILIISNRLLLMVGKTKTLLIDLLITSLLNLILNLILIPKEKIFFINNHNGLNGAAIATTISIILFYLLLMIHARKFTKITPFKKDFFKIIFISIIPTIILLIIKSVINLNKLYFIMLAIFFFSFYILLLFLMKGLDKEDLLILARTKERFSNKINKKDIIKLLD